MAWLRLGDNAHGHPLRLALIDPKNEMEGKAAWAFFIDVADMCAEQFTDYVVPRGFIDRAGAGPGDILLKRCIRAGLMFPAGGKGTGRKWRIIDNAPELIHMRSRAEVQWEKDQNADTGNLRNRTVAMLRDGDACRYCGVVCQPNDHRAGRGRSLDHVVPGRKALSPDDLVTCCVSCNSARNRDWQNKSERAGFAARWPLRSVPDRLVFRQSTVDWLASKGHQIPPGSLVAPSGVVLNDWTEAQTTPSTTTKTSRTPAGRSRPSSPPAAEPTSGPSTTSDTQHQAPARVAGPDGTTSEAQHQAEPARVASPDGTTSDDQHPGPAPGVARPDGTTGGPTHTAPSAVARPPAGTTHPDPSGVALPDPPTDPNRIRGSGGDVPGRAGRGSGAGPPPPEHPPDRPAGTRRTRRGRRHRGAGYAPDTPPTGDPP